MCEIRQINKIYSFFIVITFSMAMSDDFSIGEKQTYDYENVYPIKGTWFKDISSGRFYFKSVNCVFVQRNDLYYSKWVIDENLDYKLDSKYKWTWDKQGMFYPVMENCTNSAEEYQPFAIPISCIATICPNQMRFPSGGIWHYTNCKLMYDLQDVRFELSPDGFYKKINLTRNTQMFPDRWTWDPMTGEWLPARINMNIMYNLGKGYTSGPVWNKITDTRNPPMMLPQNAHLKN